MGLDITAYSKARKIDCLFDKDGDPVDPETHEPIDDYVQVSVSFPERADGLEDGAVYTTEDCFAFRAGGYIVYNVWRDQLAELAGYPEDPTAAETEQRHCTACWNGQTGPFSELINFSDCEGVIGPQTSAKLAADFEQFQASADAHPDANFREKYTSFRKAFDLASDGGLVDFH